MAQRPATLKTLPNGDSVRPPMEEDHPRVQVALTDWWGELGGEAGALQRRLLVPRLFLQHFTGTSFVVEGGDGSLRAFLVGFLSQSQPDAAYIHFVGVGPQSRRLGLGRTLYLDFFELARTHGRSTVRCITSPVNRDSIAFHTRMGFRMEPGDRTDGEIPTHTDYDGAGLDRVCFVHNL